MKQDEVKLKLRVWSEGMIDQIFPLTSGNIFDTFKNSTAKLWIEQNISRLDPILKVFADATGDIDIPKITGHYSQSLFINGDLRLDIKSLVPKEYGILKEFLPNKVILLKAEDIAEIFKT